MLCNLPAGTGLLRTGATQRRSLRVRAKKDKPKVPEEFKVVKEEKARKAGFDPDRPCVHLSR
jgi:hypothetical protein